MKNDKKAAERIELGEYIVADPEICHGKPTFKGTRIMVWQVLDDVAAGRSGTSSATGVGKAAFRWAQ